MAVQFVPSLFPKDDTSDGRRTPGNFRSPLSYVSLSRSENVRHMTATLLSRNIHLAQLSMGIANLVEIPHETSRDIKQSKGRLLNTRIIRKCARLRKIK